MNSPEDDLLRAHFAELREQDRSAAPSFGKTASAVAALPRRNTFLRVAFAAIPLLAIAVMVAVRTHSSSTAVPRQLAEWSSPTSFLLETPGRQLLNQIPRLGEPLIQAVRANQDEPK
jgi:hypothetical protein